MVAQDATASPPKERRQSVWDFSALSAAPPKAEASAPEPPPPPARPAVASKCSAEGKGLEVAIARKKASFVIQTRAADGTPCEQGGELFSVSVTGTSVVHARVHDKEDGTYVVEYKASTAGKYNVSIMLHGLALPGSPWKVEVVMPKPDAAQCYVRGDALTAAAAREVVSFEVGFVDAMGHATHAEDLDVWVSRIDEGGGSGSGGGGGDDDGGLERLERSGAEAAARAWAREWAFERAAVLRARSVDMLKAQMPPPPAAPPPAAADAAADADADASAAGGAGTATGAQPIDDESKQRPQTEGGEGDGLG